MSNKLKGKKILITAGPTWVAIDSVRVISNTATGETGIILTERLTQLGADVTLLLGPVGVCCLNKKIKLIHFRFLEEFKKEIIRQLKLKRFEIVIHSAAVSDYKPVKTFSRKIKSGIKNLNIKLKPTSKVIDSIKKYGGNLFLIGFKFEPGADKDRLIKRARGLIKRSGVDLVVANTVISDKYQAYLVNPSQIQGPIFRKEALAKEIINFIGGHICNN